MDQRIGIDLAHVSAGDDQRVCPNCGTGLFAPPRMSPTVCEGCLLALALEDTAEDIQELASGGRLSEASRSIGSYLLMDEIGRGGMGVIYRAVHRQTGATVALKTVLQEHVGCTETSSRFRREAEAASSLNHPNVMPIYEVGEANGEVPFFCMKLAEHGSLHQLRGKYRGRWRQIAELMVKLAEAVHCAHQNGILHRDIKPGNILFDEDHTPLVTDFGLAKRITSSDVLTHSCSVLGTPSYIAPEQAAGKTKDVTESVDVYGLGAVFYELLTDRPPFVGDNPLDVLRQAAENSPVRPRRLVPSVPDALEAICLRCLRRDPRNRYASALDLAQDLTLWLQGRKIKTTVGFSRFTEVLRTHLAAFKVGIIILSAVLALGIGWGIRPRATSPMPVRTAAVLIEDWGDDASSSGLAIKLSDEFQHGMTQTSEFRVLGGGTSRPSAPGTAVDPVAYGRSNKAQVVLSGCVRRSGQSLRLVAWLVDCDTGKTMWRHARNIPLAQVEATLPITVKSMISDIEDKRRLDTRTVLPPHERVPAPEAQKLYMRAMELVARTNRYDIDTAATFMQRAVEVDPQFTLASGMLAFTFWIQADSFGEMDKLPLAYKAAKRTLELNPDSAQAHRVIAACLQKETRYREALEEFWAALEIDPQSVGCCQSLALCLREMGQPRRSLRWLHRAVSLDPSRGACYLSLAESFAICGLDQEAEEALTRKVELDTARSRSGRSIRACCGCGKRGSMTRGGCVRKLRSEYPMIGAPRPWPPG